VSGSELTNTWQFCLDRAGLRAYGAVQALVPGGFLGLIA